MNEITLESKKIYDGRIFQIFCDDVELSDGKKTKREMVNHLGGVVICAEIKGKILMVKQFRYPIKQVVWELPAGKLDKKNEEILCAAKRELEEETGYIASDWESLGYIYTTPGYSDEKLFLFKASNLQYKKQKLDEGEILESFSVEKEKVFNMIKTGEINDAKTISAIMRAYKL